MIELALLMPVILAVVLLIVQVALWFHGRQVAEAAAREGARVARAAPVDSGGWEQEAPDQGPGRAPRPSAPSCSTARRRRPPRRTRTSARHRHRQRRPGHPAAAGAHLHHHGHRGRPDRVLPPGRRRRGLRVSRRGRERGSHGRRDGDAGAGVPALPAVPGRGRTGGRGAGRGQRRRQGRRPGRLGPAYVRRRDRRRGEDRHATRSRAGARARPSPWTATRWSRAARCGRR